MVLRPFSLDHARILFVAATNAAVEGMLDFLEQIRLVPAPLSGLVAHLASGFHVEGGGRQTVETMAAGDKAGRFGSARAVIATAGMIDRLLSFTSPAFDLMLVDEAQQQAGTDPGG